MKEAKGAVVMASGEKKGDSLPGWITYHLGGTWQKVGPVWVGHVILTPDAAKFILEHHDRKENRNLIRYNLSRIKKCMLEDVFHLTGETIIFDIEGDLRNGRHRTTACKETEVSVPVLMVYGVSLEAFKFMDQGAKRTVQNVLAMEGEKHSAALASALTFFYTFLQKGTLYKSSSQMIAQLTIQDNFDLLEQHPGLRKSTQIVCGLSTISRYVSGHGVNCAFHYIFSQYDERLATAFYQTLHYLFMGKIGENSLPHRWQPVYRLFRILSQNYGTVKKYEAKIITCLIIKAWNYLISGVMPKELRYRNDDPYPQILGWEYDEQGVPVNPLKDPNSSQIDLPDFDS